MIHHIKLTERLKIGLQIMEENGPTNFRRRKYQLENKVVQKLDFKYAVWRFALQ